MHYFLLKNILQVIFKYNIFLRCNDRRKISYIKYRKSKEYFSLFSFITETNETENPESEIVSQWAWKIVKYSAESSSGGYYASNLLGPPDYYPSYGPSYQSWGTNSYGNYIEVTFKSVQISAEINVIIR